MKRLDYILILLCSLWMFACDREQADKGAVEALPASLSLSLSSVGLSVDSRGVDDLQSDPSSWTAMDRAIDGREIYRLTLFLVNSGNTLVAYRDIYNTGGEKSADIDEDNGFWTGVSVGQNLTVGDKVKCTFHYDRTKHGKIEELVQGEYTLIAIANYSAYEDVADGSAPSYKGLGNGEYTELIERIKKGVHPTTGLANFSFSNKDQRSDSYKFFHYQLHTGDDFICPKLPQPLTVVKKISLRPGKNVVSAELKRTYARIRLQLSNNSEKVLFNDNLQFNARFATRHTYLLENPDDPNFVYTGAGTALGAPLVTSENAVVPYKASRIEGEQSVVLFDAYILESKGEAVNYQYTMKVGYRDELLHLSTEPIKDITSLAEWLAASNRNEDYYLMIKNSHTGRYLIHNQSNSISHTASTSVTNETDLLWIVSTDGNQNYPRYTIQRFGDNKYVGPLWRKVSPGKYQDPYLDGLSSISLTPSREFHSIAQDANYPDGGLVVYQEPVLNGKRKTFYLCMKNIAGWSVGSQEGVDENVPFVFYPVHYIPFTGVPVVYNKPIQLQIINPVTSQVTDLTNIKRNDFVKIYVNSSYSDVNSVMGFEVQPWLPKNSEIEFN